MRKPSGLSCEIVSDLCLNPFSHDWHVQPSCQRPNIACPPERRVSSPGGTHIVRIRLSSKPFNHTCCEKPCQRAHFTEFPRDFHIGKDLVGGSGGQPQVSKLQGFNVLKLRPKTFKPSSLRLFSARNGIAFRFKSATNSAQAEAEDQELIKELNFWRSLL